MSDVKTGSITIEALTEHGFAPDVSVALDEDEKVIFVQFRSLSSIEDVWDCFEIPKVGFVPARRTDGTMGPNTDAVGGALRRARKRFRTRDLPVGGALQRARKRFRSGDLPIGGALRRARKRFRSGDLPVGGALRRARNRFRDRDLPVGGSGSLQGDALVSTDDSDFPALGLDWGANRGVVPPIEISAADGPHGPIAVSFSGVELKEDQQTAKVQVAVKDLSHAGFKVLIEFEGQIMIDQPFMEPCTRLGNVHSVEDFRAEIGSITGLSMEAREVLVEQAIVLIRDIYVHLPLKRAMHSIDPVQRLRLLQQRLCELPVLEFHAELLDIFKELRDLHTNLTLPFPFGSQIAFLGVMVERFFKDDEPRYVVSKIAGGLNVDDDFVEGVEVTHWNGMPIDDAVARNADKEAGSNMPSRMARGLENLTLRSLRTSLVPDEDWVDLTYVKDGTVYETRLHWLVYETFEDVEEILDEGLGSAGSYAQEGGYNLAIDERQMLFGLAKQKLFCKTKAKQEEKTKAQVKAETDGDQASQAPQATVIRRVQTNPHRAEISAEVIADVDGTEFGYIRLWSFFMRDRNIDGFIHAFVRLLEDEMPKNGLVIDVRANGGGFIIAAEFLLQLLTWRRISPQPAQFIASSAALDLARKVPGMHQWAPSLQDAVQTGALFSKALPISPPDLVNSIGQIYFGPVVLITDAFCYSACDMFAAGFQDHEIGTILGVDERTGAGGANVVTHTSLLGDWHGSPLEALPGGAGMRVSLRRTMRVKDRAGDPVEDLGVTPDFLHNITLNDLMNGNEDLRAHAMAILRQGQPRTFDVAFSQSGTQLVLELEVVGIESVDVYLDGRPISQHLTDGGTIRFEMALPEGHRIIELLGYGADGKMAGRRVVKFSP